jgi:hypothetical protein
MTHPHERALEAAAMAAMNAWEAIPDCPGKMYGQEAEVVARAAVTAYLAEAGDGWRDIKSAPKDGTTIIIWSRWQSEPVTAACGSRGKWIARWDGSTVISSQGDTWTDYAKPDPPTHWRPLPAPPALAQDPRP